MAGLVPVTTPRNTNSGPDLSKYLNSGLYFLQVYAWLDGKEADCGDRCTVEYVGDSTEDRPLRVYKVGTKKKKKNF